MESWRPLALHPPTSQLPMSRGGADALLASDAVIRNEAAKSGGISSDIGESVLGFAIPSVTCFFPSERFDVYDTAGVARFHVSPPLSRDDRQRGVVLELRHGTAKGGARIAVLREEFGWCREASWVVDGGPALREQRLLLRPLGGPCCIPRCFAMGVGVLGQPSAGVAHALRGPPFPAPRHAAADRKVMTAGERAAREGAMREKEATAAAAARAGLWDPDSPHATWRGRACCLNGGVYTFVDAGLPVMGTLEPASGACAACAGQHVAYRLRVTHGADEAAVLMLAMAQLHQEHRLCGAEGMANFNGHRIYGMH